MLNRPVGAERLSSHDGFPLDAWQIRALFVELPRRFINHRRIPRPGSTVSEAGTRRCR